MVDQLRVGAQLFMGSFRMYRKENQLKQKKKEEEEKAKAVRRV